MNEDQQPRHPAAAPGSDEFLRFIVESATDFAIFSMDPTGLVSSWNKGAERILGYTETEILGHTADVVFTPEDRMTRVPEQERQQALSTGRAEDDRWTLRKDGTRFWASGIAMPLSDPSIGFVKIFRDRTEAHRSEALLRESEERFRLLATSIPQLVFLTRNDGWRTWGSPQWIDFTGLSLDDSLGTGWLEAIHPDDRDATQAGWSKAQRTGEYYVEHRVRRARYHDYRWHQTRARPINNVRDADWVGTMTDIHDLRSLKDRQQVLMGELQHRTRNLLAVVQAAAVQTRRNSTSLEEFEKEFESRLRALSRVQSLLARADFHDLDLRDLVMAELVAHGDGRPDDKTRVEGPLIPLSAASAQALGLALHELATNAVKYGALAQPGGHVDVVWREEADDGKRWAVVQWIESGVAIPQAPRRKGYGTELIERALPFQLGAKTRLEFAADGVHCTLMVPLNGPETEEKHG